MVSCLSKDPCINSSALILTLVAFLLTILVLALMATWLALTFSVKFLIVSTTTLLRVVVAQCAHLLKVCENYAQWLVLCMHPVLAEWENAAI